MTTRLLKTIVLATALYVPMGGHAQDVEYHINGAVAANVGRITVSINGERKSTDTLTVVGGHFKVSGKAPKNSFIVINDGAKEVAIVNDGTPASVDLKDLSITGSAENTRFGSLQKDICALRLRSDSAANKATALKGDTSAAAKEELHSLSTVMRSADMDIAGKAYNYALDNKNTVSPAWFAGIWVHNLTREQMKDVFDTAATYYSHPFLESFINYYNAPLRRKVGAKFTDFELQDAEGKTVSVSQYIGHGHYTLVDFWASWCVPCIKETPYLIAAYDRYHTSKGFEIVGVSLDSNRKQWLKAVKEHQMTWPQLCAAEGEGNPAVDLYGIRGIPDNILVGPDGTVVTNDLRGEGLLKKLAEIYGE